MIIALLIVLVVALVGTAFSALPTSSIGYLDPSRYTGLTTQIGDFISRWDSITNSILIVQITGIVMGVILPTVMLYKVINWIYKHIPQLGGFGPGSG